MNKREKVKEKPKHIPALEPSPFLNRQLAMRRASEKVLRVGKTVRKVVSRVEI